MTAAQPPHAINGHNRIRFEGWQFAITSAYPAAEGCHRAGQAACGATLVAVYTNSCVLRGKNTIY